MMLWLFYNAVERNLQIQDRLIEDVEGAAIGAAIGAVVGAGVTVLGGVVPAVPVGVMLGGGRRFDVQGNRPAQTRLPR